MLNVTLSPQRPMGEREIRSSVSDDCWENVLRCEMRHPAGLTKTEYEMLAAFRYYVRRYVRFSEVVTEAAGLGPRQYQALLAIKGFPNREEITISELAEQLQIANHSAVGLIDLLAQQNLIARKQSVGDRHRVYLKLTKRGTKILERLVVTHRREIGRMGKRLEMALQGLTLDPVQ